MTAQETSPAKPSDEGRWRALIQRLEALSQFLHQCQSCQTFVPSPWQYCAGCGLRLSTRCPGCDNPVPPRGARYCPHCGLPLPQQGTPEGNQGE